MAAFVIIAVVAPVLFGCIEWGRNNQEEYGVYSAYLSEDLERTIYIRGKAFLAIEALNRNATHTAYHVGQIVYLARHFAAPDWKSRSIPKGQSAELTRDDFKSKGIARTNP